MLQSRKNLAWNSQKYPQNSTFVLNSAWWPACYVASVADPLGLANGPRKWARISGVYMARWAWFPKNPRRWRVRGQTVIRAPWPRRTFPTFSPPLHLLPHAHTASPGNCSATRATASEQSPLGHGSVRWGPKETTAIRVEHHASSIAPRNGWSPSATRRPSIGWWWTTCCPVGWRQDGV